MQAADRYAASLMADRSKGALPTVFERKNPLTRLLTMYQVEVNNQLRHLFKDLPDDLKEKGMAALVAGLMKYTIGALSLIHIWSVHLKQLRRNRAGPP